MIDRDKYTEGTPTADVLIIVEPDGPLLVAGPHRIEEEVRLVSKLCRCGMSATKPFCDDAHLRARWSEQTDAEDVEDEGEEG